jgi:hypothetical protein
LKLTSHKHVVLKESILYSVKTYNSFQNGAAVKKVNLYLDDDLWQAFRITCLEQKISASQQIGLLLVQFLHKQECQGNTSAKAGEKALPTGDQSP